MKTTKNYKTMGLHKGQTNNPNGRPAGKQNKLTTQTKDWISQLIDRNKKQIEKDLKSMDAETRVKALFSLLNYIVPKQSTISIEEQAKIEEEALIKFLETAPDEAIEAIAAKVIEMQQKNETSQSKQ
ncbi:MAG: hypothetical protein IKH61_06005 [Bacteroidales bacterium]|nr:hypothetical protein [Bacteroidales bacterium]